MTVRTAKQTFLIGLVLDIIQLNILEGLELHVLTFQHDRRPAIRKCHRPLRHPLREEPAEVRDDHLTAIFHFLTNGT